MQYHQPELMARLRELQDVESNLTSALSREKAHTDRFKQRLSEAQSDTERACLLSVLNQRYERQTELHERLDEVIHQIHELEEELRNIRYASEHSGLSNEEIQQIPTTTLISMQETENKASCSVCLMEYQEGETVAKLPCTDIYHTNCITQWLKASRTCPYCRTVVGN